MCMGSTPKIEPAKPAPPPAPPAPPPVEELTPVKPADDTTRTTDSRRRGRSALRIDRTAPTTGGTSGLNIPI